MKTRLLLLFIVLLFTAACSRQAYNEQHEVYLSNKGWNMKESIEVETYLLDIPDEMLSNYEASGITFLSDYIGEEVTEYSYELKEKDIEGKHLKAFLLELEGKIIGSYGVLPSWDPGLFNLDEKERLLNEQMIKQ